MSAGQGVALNSIHQDFTTRGGAVYTTNPLD